MLVGPNVRDWTDALFNVPPMLRFRTCEINCCSCETRKLSHLAIGLWATWIHVRFSRNALAKPVGACFRAVFQGWAVARAVCAERDGAAKHIFSLMYLTVQPLRKRLVPRRGLEPPRIASLVPETSASTNSATWARASHNGDREKGKAGFCTGARGGPPALTSCQPARV